MDLTMAGNMPFLGLKFIILANSYSVVSIPIDPKTILKHAREQVKRVCCL